LKDLLFKLLKRNPIDRINFEDFLQHPFLIAPDPNVKKTHDPRSINIASSPIAFNKNLKRSSIEKSDYEEKCDEDSNQSEQTLFEPANTSAKLIFAQGLNFDRNSDQKANPIHERIRNSTTHQSLPKPSVLSNMTKFRENRTIPERLIPINREASSNYSSSVPTHQLSTSPLAAQQSDQDLDDYVLVYNKNKDQLAQIEEQPIPYEDMSNKAMPVPTQVDNYKLLEKKIQKIKTPPRSIGLQTEGERDRTYSSNSADHAYSISPPAIKFLVGTSPTTNIPQNNLPRYSSSFNNHELFSKRLRQSSVSNPIQLNRPNESKFNF
jgi:hypothetical protein